MNALKSTATAISTPPCDPEEMIPQSRLGRELFVGKFSSKPVDYMTIWRAVASGKIDLEPIDGVNNRQGVRRKNLSAVAAALNLRPVNGVPA